MAPTKSLPAVPAFEIRRSRIQGRGGFATRRIKRGERVGEYTGERISQTEADRRYDDDAMARHHTFLFAVSARTVIDAAVGGNDTRFINHSCAPNCDAVIERGRVFIDARKPIFEGEELFYDYSYEREKDAGPDAESQYPCWCGAAKCRGTILMPKKRKRSKARGVRRPARRKTKPQTRRQGKR
jgi:SET domain-containing protein